MHVAAVKYAVPKLSDLLIDADKDWNTKKIENLGAPDSYDDATRGVVERLVDIYSIDYGLNWADLGAISYASGAIEAMAYLGNGITILGDDSGHIHRSTDYGATWTDLGEQGPGAGDTAMAYLGNGIAIIGDLDNHVQRSTDYGATWTDLGAVATLYTDIYAMAYLGNGIAILGDSDSHVCRSTDYGASWTDLGVIASDAIRVMAYLGYGIAILGDDAHHVWRSTDYGANWTDLGVVASDAIWAMAYLGNGITILGDDAYHIYHSTDYGATWTDLGAVASSSVQVITYLGNGIVILGDAAYHVYRSTDYGATWTDLGVIASDLFFAASYLGNGVVIMGDNDGHVYRSTSAFQLSNFNPNQFDKVLQFGCLGVITANGTSYLAPGNGTTQTNEIKARVPHPGILKDLYVWQRVASGAAGRTDIYTVRVNGADKAITCTLDNATTGADTTHTQLVAAGDQISIKLVSNNASDTSADVIATLELI